MKKLFLACCLLAIATPAVAQTEVPTAEALGSVMGEEMCNELITNQTMMGDAAFERVYEQISAEYGDNATIFFMQLGDLFSQPATVIANDPYAFNMFQTIFRHVTEDETCFRAFLEYEVFADNAPITEEIPSP